MVHTLALILRKGIRGNGSEILKMEKVELSLILGTVFFPNGDELEAIFLNGKMD